MKLRRIAISTAGVALAAALTVPAAGAAPAAPTAAPADTYGAQATASALRLNLFGQQLTVGSGTSDVTSPDSATATGNGALIVTQAFGASKAEASGVGSSQGSDTPVCSPLTLPAAVPLLDLSTACSTAKAAVTAEGSSSSATGQALQLSLGGDPLVQPVLDALPIETITDALIGGLGPLLDPLGAALPVPTDVIVDQVTGLLTDALTGDGVSLLTVEAGSAESHTSSDSDSVDASTLATGATIKVLDRGGDTFGTQPVLTIVAGESTTNVSRDRATGETTAEQTAVPVRVTVADDVALLLSLPTKSFEVPSGTTIDLPLPAPLNSSITLSSGSTSQLENGAEAESATIQISLLSGLNGGVQLGLSSGSASVVGEVAQVAPPTTVAPTPTTGAPAPGPNPGSGPAPARTSLPRTGTEEQPLHQVALALALSAAAVGGLVIRSSRRSRATVKA
ncbi:hypothetical protein BH10ACT1_BH10ACT1_32340 [soil metagenome]